MAGNKVTKNDVIKALQCCIKSTSDCDKCPLHIRGDGDCTDKAKQGALDIINQQQTAFEKSIETTKHWHREAELNAKEINKLQAEIERLKEELEIRNQKRASIFEISNAYERGRAKAIKEFAERLKKTIKKSVDDAWHSDGNGIYDAECVLDDIDNLVKEMAGEGK